MNNPGQQLTIRSLRVRPVLVPMSLPLHTASGAVETAPLILLDLQTEQGVVGRSYLFAFGAAHLRPMVAVLESMAQMIQGQPVAPFELERLLRRRHALLGVHNLIIIALSGIDMAAWDALAVAADRAAEKLPGLRPVQSRFSHSEGFP